MVLVDKTGLRPWAVAALQQYSSEKIDVFDDYPQEDSTLVERMRMADCVLVSWNTPIGADVMKQCPRLKYIGMCCSLYDESSANVDIGYAKAHHIEVRGVRDYGDEGLVEFILSELIRLIKGLGEHQWKAEAVELTNRKLGIIGMGTTGQMLANRAKAFGMQVSYYSRSRKPEVESNGLGYKPLEALLSTCEIVSTHLPKNTFLLNEPLFEALGTGKILINTSLGLTFEKDSFLRWISNEENYAILDGDGVGKHMKEFKPYPHIIAHEQVGGWTAEAVDRLSNKVVENVRSYLEVK